MRGRGSKAVWNFSKKSSDLVAGSFPYCGTTTSFYNTGCMLNISLMAAYQERSGIYCVVCSTVLLRSPSWLSVWLLTQEPNKHRKIFWIFIYSYWCCCCTFDFDTGTKQASQNLLNIHNLIVLLIWKKEPNKSLLFADLWKIYFRMNDNNKMFLQKNAEMVRLDGRCSICFGWRGTL